MMGSDENRHSLCDEVRLSVLPERRGTEHASSVTPKKCSRVVEDLKAVCIQQQPDGIISGEWHREQWLTQHADIPGPDKHYEPQTFPIPLVIIDISLLLQTIVDLSEFRSVAVFKPHVKSTAQEITARRQLDASTVALPSIYLNTGMEVKENTGREPGYGAGSFSVTPPESYSGDIRRDVHRHGSKRSHGSSGTAKGERSLLSRRLSTFTNSMAEQKFTETEKKAISKFSSVNYLPTHSMTYMQWLQEQGHWTHWEFDRWAACLLIGLFTGLVACLLKQCTEALGAVKWSRTKDLAREGRLLEAWGWNAGMSCVYIVISSFMVAFIHPPAAGGGTAEVIAFLNGIIVHGTKGLKNLIVKFISLVFCVSSGAAVGTQGPLISYGAIIGSGIGQMESQSLGFSPKLFARFRNAEDRREFTTAGVAAGVSAGFNAPMGGLLFAMEDLSSFWGKRLSWQVFFSAVVATAVAQLFNSAFTGFQFQGLFGIFNLSAHAGYKVVAPLEIHIAIIVPAIALGIIGGLLGAIFTRLNTLINEGRKIMLAAIKNDFLKKIVRMAECIVAALIMATYSTYLPSGFSCQEVTIDANQSTIIDECFYGGLNGSLLYLEKYTCEESVNTSMLRYSDAASLIQGGGGGYLDRLWSRGTHDVYGWAPCLAAFAVWFFMSIFTAGTAVAGGVFLPIVISGALYGRAMGVAGISIWRLVTDTMTVPVWSEWEWLDPGLLSVLGSASLLGGVTRLALATTVITVEMSEDINIVIPVMITIFVAKLVADAISKPLYKCQLDSKSMPFLEQEPRIVVNKHLVNLELYKARDVMACPVWTINSRETISALARLLVETSHSGFPVVKYDDETRRELAYGLITRMELYVILCSKEVYDADRHGQIVTPDVAYQELSVDYMNDPSASLERVKTYCKFPIYSKIYVNLEPFINISAPKIDEDYSLQRTYQLFRTLGLRHLVVIDIRNHVVGIVTRKDLMPFHVQERLSICEPLQTLTDIPMFYLNSGALSSRTLMTSTSRDNLVDHEKATHNDGYHNHGNHGDFTPGYQMNHVTKQVIAEDVDKEIEEENAIVLMQKMHSTNAYVNPALLNNASTTL